MFKDVRDYYDNQLVLVVDDTYDLNPHSMEKYTVARINDGYITPKGDRRRVFVETGNYKDCYRWVASEDIIPLIREADLKKDYQYDCPTTEYSMCELSCVMCGRRAETIEYYEEKTKEPSAEIKEALKGFVEEQVVMYNSQAWTIDSIESYVVDEIPVRLVGAEGFKWVDPRELEPLKAYFKEGDYIRGISNNYNFTNKEMFLAKVIDPIDYIRIDGTIKMKIKILDHKNDYEIGMVYPVDNSKEQFKKVEVE